MEDSVFLSGHLKNCTRIFFIMRFINLWYPKENIWPLHIQHTMLQIHYHVTPRGVARYHLPISVAYFVWFFNHGATAPSEPRPHYRGLTITLGRTPLDDWTAQHRNLYTQHSRNRHPCPSGTRTHNLSKRAAADPHLRPCGHWDRHFVCLRGCLSYLICKLS